MIVSNTTPLSSLLKIGQVGLLERLYGRVAIPTEVADELDQAGSVHQGWRDQAGFVHIEATALGDPVLQLLMAEVDPGEAAAIALAVCSASDLLIIDDMEGRRLAQRLGLSITGTVGVVLAAAERNLIDDAFAMLELLRTHGGLWLTDSFLDSLRSSYRS